jgi:multisubunit Na+/H+ antiporter MnhC subunit
MVSYIFIILYVYCYHKYDPIKCGILLDLRNKYANLYFVTMGVYEKKILCTCD